VKVIRDIMLSSLEKKTANNTRTMKSMLPTNRIVAENSEKSIVTATRKKQSTMCSEEH